MKNRKLIFVYNADSGFFNVVSDIAHKITSPETYQCKLCSLTHGYFKLKDQWRQFLNTTDKDFVFYHRDEFEKRYGAQDEPLPAVFVETDNGIEVLINREKIETLVNLQQLIELTSHYQE